MSSGGPVGLDYVAMHHELDDLGITGEERQVIKDDVREIEYAALKAMRTDD